MNIYLIKKIMKEINAPNEYKLSAVDLNDPNYWIFRVQNVRVKTLYKELRDYRPESARVDVFINGLYIVDTDFDLAQIDNDFHVRFKKANFPPVDGYGNPFGLSDADDIKIKGDLETIL